MLKLELFPKAKYLRFHTLKLFGVQQVYLPINEVIPITKYDYMCAHPAVFFFKQNTILDLDMIYASKSNKHMYIFDKEEIGRAHV